MNFATLQMGGFAEEDLVEDGWTDIAQRIRDRIVAAMTDAGGASRPRALRQGVLRQRRREDDRDTGAGRRDRRGPGDGRGAQALVPAAVQAALLPRRVPAGLQHRDLPPGRHRRQGGRADRRDRRGRRRHPLRPRLPDLRLRLRGPPLALRRLRDRRPGRLEALGALGRRHAHPPRRAHPRVPEPVRRGAGPGRQPDLEHHPQPRRGRQVDRGGDRPRRAGRRRGRRGHRGGGATVGGAARRPGPTRSSAAPTAPPATTTGRAGSSPQPTA